MPFSSDDIVFGIAIPAAVVMAILLLAQRFLNSANRPLALLFAILVVFPIGYFPLSLGPMVPDSHWHWLPAIVVVACLLGGCLAGIESRFVRIAIIAVAALAAGLFLVPTWPDLRPARPVYLVIWPLLTAGTMFLLSDRLPLRPARLTACAMFVVFSTTSVLIVLSDNLRFAQMAFVFVGVSLGVLACNELLMRFQRTKALATAEKALPITAYAGLPIAASLWSLLLVARVNSFSAVPLIAYLLPPVAMILPFLNLFRRSKTNAEASDLESWKSTLVQLWPSAAVCVISVIIAVAFVLVDAS